jgi:hypothetical protein
MKYCKIHKIKGTSDSGIKAVLEDMFGAISSRKVDCLNQEHVWEGIKFKQNAKNMLKSGQIVREVILFDKIIENGISSTLPKTMATLTNCKSSHNLGKKFTDEEIKQAGYTKEEFEELIK